MWDNHEIVRYRPERSDYNVIPVKVYSKLSPVTQSIPQQEYVPREQPALPGTYCRTTFEQRHDLYGVVGEFGSCYAILQYVCFLGCDGDWYSTVQ